MRQWRLLNRILCKSWSHTPIRCVLVVEELEGREVLSPIVSSPFFTPQFLENTSYAFSGSSSFSVSDSSDSGQNYSAVLTATHGTISLDLTNATNLGLSVSDNGTASVGIVGQLSKIESLLQGSGFSFSPDAYYSGDAEVDLTVTDLVNTTTPGIGGVNVQVEPVASNANLVVNAPEEVLLRSGPFAFPPGFISVTNWPDHDGSETTTVTFSLGVDDPDAFTLSAGGVIIKPIESGLWQISATDQATLQALLDSLVLTPPSGFTGRVILSVNADLVDTASSSSTETSNSSFHFVGEQDIRLRFFLGSSVTAPTITAHQGDTIDLGGKFTASDPDTLSGDTHTLTISASSGALALNSSAVPAGVSASVTHNGDGTSIVLTGDLDAINQFLATPGSLTYTAGSPFFSGRVPLTLTLVNNPGPPPPLEVMPSVLPNQSPSRSDPPASSGTSSPASSTSVASLVFLPVADHAFPSAVDVTTNQDTPVAISISVSPLADTDGSETVQLILQGVPAGATFNHGVDLGGGEWALLESDLAGLLFTPPPGQTGVYTLTVLAVVTNSAPDIGATDTATESTTFQITVVPIPAPTPAPNPQPTILLPPIIVDTPIVISPVQTALTTVTGIDTTSTTTTPSRSDSRPDTISLFYTAAAITSTDFRIAEGATRVSFAPSQSSLFTQAEAPLPIYAGGEKHPLPPVLPLDQTLPVAGFTESGGDSFALLDSLYRGATQPTAAVATPLATVRGEQPTSVAVTQVTNLVATAAITETTRAESESAGISEEQESSSEWRVAAVSLIVAPFVFWFSHKARKQLVRAVRRYLGSPLSKSIERKT